ncbi:hypothetical protein CYLTODRAFT_425960 [Cylindrobasidium torrendii FP15055 ss-10]|uniref:Uncharacterized protein n=1 Tax=Cylindrobasidium torrendii FP15055 ss-10 TaxID=1314674 RepID=A0A0D7B0E9_9AGAR|nr:hypothetical protein CYLTODRAFT_425960 [Cylindrobasidium torrendii FP15055 ss-10]
MTGALATSNTFKVKDPPYASKALSCTSPEVEYRTLTRAVTTTITASGLQPTNDTLLADATNLMHYEQRVVLGLSVALGVTAFIILLLSVYALLLRHRLSKSPSMASLEIPSHHQRLHTRVQAVVHGGDRKTSPPSRRMFAQPGGHTRRRGGVGEAVTPFTLQLPVEMQREKKVVAL